MGVFDILGRVFATPKSIEKTMDAVIATGDKLIYTQEEKADSAKLMADWYIRYLEATQPQAIARRLIAFLISVLWSAMIIAAVVAGVWTGDYGSIAILAGGDPSGDLAATSGAGFLFAILDRIINEPFTAVVIFYFGGHYLTQALREIKK